MGHFGKSARQSLLDDLSKFHHIESQPISEINDFIKEEKLFGQGVGLVDVQILYSVIVGSAQLWTFDKNLANLAKRYKVDFEPYLN